MAVRFILGRGGTGKTTHCIRAIVDALVEPGNSLPSILLVPEQATYQAERAILADERIAGYSGATSPTGNIDEAHPRLSVLSFDRLQFLLLGKNTARPALSRIGRQMIVNRILRDTGADLRVFHSSRAWPGLARRIADTIAELHQYAKTPDDIDGLLVELQKDQRNGLTAAKFTDIRLIFARYLQFIKGKFLDPDLQLTRACRAVMDSALLRRARLWVDGFAGFTTSELAVLVELLKVASDAHIALCLDPSHIDLADLPAKAIGQAGLFLPTQRTYAVLLEEIRKAKLRLVEPIVLTRPVRFADCEQLAHIERSIFKSNPLTIPIAGNVRIVSVPNERAEVRFIARQILELVRQKNYRYRDIAIVASEIERYQHYIEAYFEDYGVPFFIDRRRPLNQHAIVQLICSALQVVVGGFAGRDVFAYLKTDLVPIDRCEVDELENYCVAFGVTGSDWTDGEPWNFAPGEDEQFDERRVNRTRQKAVRPLLALRDGLSVSDGEGRAIGPEQFTRAVFALLDRLQVRAQLAGWIEEAIATDEYAAADEHRQVFDKVLDVFDELAEAFAGQSMSADDFVAIVGSAFSQLTSALIPPTLDQVLVSSIERSRHPDLKAVFLMGVTQRQFPVPAGSNSVLTDDDRRAAESARFALAPAVSQSLEERPYLAYIAFTRPSQFLCVTYPSVDEKGSAVARSQYLDELELLFENLRAEPVTAEQLGIEGVRNETELADLLCRTLGRDSVSRDADDSRHFAELLDEVASDDQLGGLGEKVCSAIGYENRARLDADVLGELYGKQIRSSATRLGTFAACPYQYFARYTLNLKERKEFKFEPLDLGTFYHRVLDGLSRQLNALGKSFADVTNDELLNYLDQQIEELVRMDSFISNFARHSRHNAFVIQSASEVLGDCVLAIGQTIRAGSFRPILSEVSFGRVKDTRDTLGEYGIALRGGRMLFMDGKIDRLDIAEIDGRRVSLVFDYKRRKQSFGWAKLYHGLDLQLPTYVLAVQQADRSPAEGVVGAFYVPVEAPTEGAAFEMIAARSDKFFHKATGLFNGQFAEHLDSEAQKDSTYYSFFVTKDGAPYGNYGKLGALKPPDFEKVLAFTRQKIVSVAEEIVSGRIAVNPYRLGGKSPCSYCDYKPLCRFDWQINDYRSLESLGKSAMLEKIRGS
ncbi:MAG: exodeoxyribonuclease V subunit gamma [Phycisphaerales bacterium]|nr:MAG: exodeoxyribonuclease V subunit gamma [Phycisphaerales bacterium]